MLSMMSTSAVKDAPFLNSQNPVIVSLAALDAGPLAQSSLTNEIEAVLVRLNMFGSKDNEPTWVYVEPKSLVTSMPLKKPASVLKSVPQEN